MTIQVFDAAHAQYLSEQDHGVLATLGPDGSPQAKPVGFRYDPQRATIDIGGIDLQRSAKFRNVATHPQVAFTIEDMPDQSAGAAGVRFMEIRGTAEQLEVGDPPYEGVSPWIIRIHPTRVISYKLAGSGAYSADLDGGHASQDPVRLAATNSTMTASRSLPTQASPGSPRWPCTCSCAAGARGGWSPARTPRSTSTAGRCSNEGRDRERVRRPRSAPGRRDRRPAS